MSTRETMPLRIGDGSDWRFVNGAWVDGEGGELCVPDELVRSVGYGMEGMHYAFHRTLCCRDCLVRFEFRLTAHSGVGIVLRARDESHFYLLHFPNCGQQSRAQHFWAALSRMDDSGWHRIVNMELVRRVPSTLELWLQAEMRLDGRRFAVVLQRLVPRPGSCALCPALDPPGFPTLAHFRDGPERHFLRASARGVMVPPSLTVAPLSVSRCHGTTYARIAQYPTSVPERTMQVA